jgi:hypothetical protein
VRLHHAEGLLDPQAERTSHTSGDMTAQGTQVARHGAPGFHIALLRALTCLKGRIPQSLQFMLRGIVGHLHRLGPCR